MTAIDLALLEFKAEVVMRALLREFPGRSVVMEPIIAMLAQGKSVHHTYDRLAEERSSFVASVTARLRRFLRV